MWASSKNDGVGMIRGGCPLSPEFQKCNNSRSANPVEIELTRTSSMASAFAAASQRALGRRAFSSDALLKTMLYDLHLERGGKMVPFAGYELPVQYAGIGVLKEHMHCRSPGKSSLFDVSHLGQIKWTGADRAKFLERVRPRPASRAASRRRGRRASNTNPAAGRPSSATSRASATARAASRCSRTPRAASSTTACSRTPATTSTWSSTARARSATWPTSRPSSTPRAWTCRCTTRATTRRSWPSRAPARRACRSRCCPTAST